MIRRVIRIDEAKCNGCGACAQACHEGAIAMVDGKARLMREDFCDGLGDCLPACPTGAITFEEREAPAYDAAAVQAAKQAPCGCPGNAAQALRPRGMASEGSSGLGDCLPACPTGAITFEEREAPAYDAAAVQAAKQAPCGCPGSAAQALRPRGAASEGPSGLGNWPVQLRLAPVNAPWLQGADVVLAADCTAYACGDFHRRFLQGAALLIACPKLDDAPYADKLAAMLRENDVRSLTVVRMDVPCCGGLTRIAQQALAASGKDIPFQVTVIHR